MISGCLGALVVLRDQVIQLLLPIYFSCRSDEPRVAESGQQQWSRSHEPEERREDRCMLVLCCVRAGLHSWLQEALNALTQVPMRDQKA